MKFFEVYSHPTYGITAVKNGFAWPGCVFSWIWLLLCGMWVRSIAALAIPWVGSGLLVMVYGVLFTAGDTPFAEMEDESVGQLYINVAGACGLIVSLIVGAKGNAWRRTRLLKRGFEHVKSVHAQSADAAVAQASAEQKTPEAETA